MHNNVTGIPLFEQLKKYKTMEERIQYVLRFFRDITGLDLTEYFKQVFTLDYISLNEDRHFHNLGIIMDGQGNYRSAPIFDNGKLLLNCNPSKNFNLSIEENVTRVTDRPFSGSHKQMYDYFGKGFSLDKEKALKWLMTEEKLFYRDVLEYQIKQFL